MTVKTATENTQEKPTTPTHLHSMGQTSSSVSLMWGASLIQKGIKQYNIYRNNQLIGSTKETEYEVSGLAANTAYHSGGSRSQQYG